MELFVFLLNRNHHQLFKEIKKYGKRNTFAFRGELFTGTHNFASGGDSFKLALYTANPYNTSSTVYNATSEVSASGTNYTTTGNTLAGNAVAYTTAVASCDFT